MINYLLEIVQINPLKQPLELEHWRFIHRSKAELADIDIDLNSSKADVVFAKTKEYMNNIGGDLAHVGTYRTETLKSAIQTACRGMNISGDIGMYLSSLIPIERGTVWSLQEVLYGNEADGKEPCKDFIREVNKYEGLMEIIQGVEGLISGRGVHASGIIPALDMLDCTPLMKAPNGSITTQYDLGDCEKCGGLKLDFLKTEAVNMIQQTMDLLIEYGNIKQYDTLKETYRNSIHPNVLNFENSDLFKVLGEGKLLKAFQYETLTGTKTLQTIKPQSLIELTNTNSLMRLMTSDKEQPAERYIRLRDNPEQWEQEMIDFGLNEYERGIMHEHLDKDCGTLSSQEGMMLLLMDERIANFDVPRANSFRKSISKKDKKKIKKSTEDFFKAGRELGTRDVMMKYVLDVQIAMQMGYGFSKHHCVPYSMIALQEANFIVNYPPIYWATAVLMTESGTIERESEEGDGKEGGTDYDSLGSAIANLQKQGVVIDLPNINNALTGFKPDEATNSIIFGMKGISSINNKTSEIIIANRPYTSMKDFHDRLHLVKHETFTKDGKKQMKALITKEQMINLIKAGAFDEIEPNKTRTQVLEEYLHMEYPDKKSITTSNLPQLIYRGLIPSEYDEELRLFEMRQYLREGMCVADGELPHHKAIEGYKATKSKKWYLLDGVDEDDTLDIYNIFLEAFPELQEGEHYYFASDYDDNNEYWSNAIWVECGASSKKAFEGIYKGKIKRLLEYLTSKELLARYNESLFNDIKQQYMKGTESTWEFEAMAYYHGDHEVSMINQDLYNISNFHDLPEEPKVIDHWVKTDKETGQEIKIPKFEINQICGVVLGKNKNKNIITLLTPTGTVYCKFNRGSFSHYDRSISIPDEETGKSKVVDKSWFQRGSILMIRGIRRGSQFTVKNYKNSLWSHSVSLVERIYDDGIALTKDERYYVD